MDKSLNVGIIGCGNIGLKRANAILGLGKDSVKGVFDVDQQAMEKLSAITGAKTYTSWQKLLTASEIECVVVSIPPKSSQEIALQALKSGKHVLVEKPLGSYAEDAKKILQAATKYKKVLKVGFNHRFHPAVQKAHQLLLKGSVGKLMYIRAVYGHGGRAGYDTEWRMQKKYSRGGELFDQGVHLIDLSRWFAGDFNKVFAINKNYFWDKSPLEDNSFCNLISKAGPIVSFHTSITQWKNTFSFEVFGDEGYLFIHGLGRSYGTETLIYGKNVSLGKPSLEKKWEFSGVDQSWGNEWLEFRKAVITGGQVMSSAAENFEVMKLLDALYKSAKLEQVIKI